MKLTQTHLRSLIRKALLEAGEERPTTAPLSRPTQPAPTEHPPTVPASASRSEQEFQKDMGGKKWGAPENSLRDDPVNKKLQKVISSLKASGQLEKVQPNKRAEAIAKLEKFVKEMDPSDRLVKTADEIADEFVKTHSN